jgi:hypothetical protein
MEVPAPGNFSFLDNHSCEMLADAYRAINQAEAWDLMKIDPGTGGYMFGADNRYDIIKIKYRGHSGLSHAWTMRAMQFLAQNGWAVFYQTYRPKN